MMLPLQITYRNLHRSAAVDREIHSRVEKLSRFFNRITSCRVMLEALRRHHRKGNVFAVHIDITVPGKEIAISRESAADIAHEDIYIALRDAFQAARRCLKNHSRIIKKTVKKHATPAHGEVRMIQDWADFGIIQTPDAREVYFHRNSVLNAKFEALNVGTRVRFHEVPGEQGARASSIAVEGKHHVVG